MIDANKHNLLYFESNSMKELYNTMEEWQQMNSKRLLSTNIQQDNGKFCCIALSNPTEVIICSGSGGSQADVSGGNLNVSDWSR
ncbi:MAG: hypothetical protein H8D24_02195 [Gammaproteobacteria bacterium]|uniref:Uncharacterized protein n=1 Tax=Candidatus Thiopontia autotrophica TaxID=2841688 RepID=A0A8J6P6T3_9GAMM|nr:hypothetical protein [Candidatus Thiopontia autotrophica]